MLGSRETIEQPLVRVAREDELEVFARLACEPQQTSAHGGVDVLGRLRLLRRAWRGSLDSRQKTLEFIFDVVDPFIHSEWVSSL